MNQSNQSGAALLVALVMLLAITLLGVSSLRSGMFHERMSLNSQADTLTFMGAESAINAILSTSVQVGENGVDGSFMADAALGATQLNCVTQNDVLAQSCGSSHFFDVRSAGALQAQTETDYDDYRRAYNTDGAFWGYHQFATQGVAYFHEDLDLPFASKNEQKWKKLGPEPAFAVANADVLKAAGE